MNIKTATPKEETLPPPSAPVQNNPSNTPVSQIFTTRLLASATTATAMYPLDLARALRMEAASRSNEGTIHLLRQFIGTHGLSGLFKQGVIPEVTRATLMRTWKFVAVPITHQILFNTKLEDGSTKSVMISASIASTLEAILISPAEVAKIGLQFDKEKIYGNSMWRMLSAIAKERGPITYFAGLPALIPRQAVWSAVFFACINNYRTTLTPLFHQYLPQQPAVQGFRDFTVGVSAGVTATVFNTPFDVVRMNVTNQELQRKTTDVGFTKNRFSFNYMKTGITNCTKTAAKIVEARGISGLWQGFVPKAMHLGASGGMMLFTIGFFNKLLNNVFSEPETNSTHRLN